MTPKVSILMAVHNGASWLPDVLDAVRAQTYPADALEVRVIDNASTDATREIIHRYLETVNCKLETSAENIGFWAAMERLVAQTDTPYVIALTDVVLHPAFITEAVAALERDPAIGAIQGKIHEQHRRSDGAWERTRRIDAVGFRLERSRRVTILGHGETDRGQYDAPRDVFGVEGAAPVFRRTALDDCRVDGHITDPDYRIGALGYGDDFDLAWRMRNRKWRQVMIPTAIGWHDRSTTKGVARTPVIGQLARIAARQAIPLAKRRLDWSNIRFSIIKNDPIIDILRDMPQIAAREIAVFGYTLLFEPAVLAECGRFFRLLPTMLRKRRAIRRRTAL